MARKNRRPRRKVTVQNHDGEWEDEIVVDHAFRRVQRVQDLRRGNAATAIPSGKVYKRPNAGGRGADW